MTSTDTKVYQPVSSFELGISKERKMEPVKTYRQFMAAVVANFASIAVGTTLGWTSPISPKLFDATRDDNPLSEPYTTEADAWVGSLLALGALFAPFVAGPLADKIGRKWTLLSGSVFFVISFILLLTTNSVEQIYAARLIQGFGVGFVMTVTPMYCGEIATDSCRGAIGSLMQLLIVSGILYVYAVGPFVSYYATQWACVVFPLIFAGSFFFMPESPYYFVMKGRKFEAISSLKYLRGQSAEGVQDEMAIIQAAVEEATGSKGSVMDLFTNKGNLKALIISCGLISFQQLSGINVVLFNGQTIFQMAGTGMDPAISTILVGFVQVISSGCTPLIVDRLGRKPILLVSASVMCLGLTTLGLFFYLVHIGSDVSNISWLPVTSLIVYVAVYCVGFGPLPWAVLGEMFPGNVKSIASSIVTSNCWVLGFLVTRFFPALNLLGTHFAFWLFAVFCAIAFTFVLTIVMETKGLSLKDIQDRLNGR